MKTIYEILYEKENRSKERKKGKESLPDRYILKSIENMINNLEKDKEYKIFDNMINRFINDIKFKIKELES